MNKKSFSLHIDVDLDKVKKATDELDKSSEGLKALASDPIPFLEKCGIKLDDSIVKHIRQRCSAHVAARGHLIKV